MSQLRLELCFFAQDSSRWAVLYWMCQLSLGWAPKVFSVFPPFWPGTRNPSATPAQGPSSPASAGHTSTANHTSKGEANMSEVKSVSFVLENCEVLTFDREYIGAWEWLDASLFLFRGDVPARHQCLYAGRRRY